MLDTLSQQVHLALLKALSAAYAENAASLGIKQLLGGLIQLDAVMFDRILPSDQWERLRQRFTRAKPLSEFAGQPHADLQLSEEVAELFMVAKNQADVFGEPVAGTRHLVLSLALRKDGPASEVFKECGVDLCAMADKIRASELAPEVVRTRVALKVRVDHNCTSRNSADKGSRELFHAVRLGAWRQTSAPSHASGWLAVFVRRSPNSAREAERARGASTFLFKSAHPLRVDPQSLDEDRLYG